MQFQNISWPTSAWLESSIHGVCECKEEVLDVVFFVLGSFLMLFHVSFLHLLDQEVVILLLCCAILRLISCGLLSKWEGISAEDFVGLILLFPLIIRWWTGECKYKNCTWCQGLAKLLEAENSSFCVGLMVKEQKYKVLEKLNVQRENVVLQKSS